MDIGNFIINNPTTQPNLFYDGLARFFLYLGSKIFNLSFKGWVHNISYSVQLNPCTYLFELVSLADRRRDIGSTSKEVENITEPSKTFKLVVYNY